MGLSCRMEMGRSVRQSGGALQFGIKRSFARYGTSGSANINSPQIFAFTHDLLGDPFWKVFEKGLCDAADQFACQVHHFRTASYSPLVMRNLLNQALTERPDAILSSVPDVEAVDQPLREAIASGIPVIAVNAEDPRPGEQQIPYLLFIGSNDKEGGRKAGQRLIEDGGCRAALCLDHYARHHTCHFARYEGLAEVMESVHAECERVPIPGDDPAEAAFRIRDYLAKRRDVDAVVTLGPPGASALFLALTDPSAWRGLRHVTFDLSSEQIAALRDGRVAAVIDSQQYLQAYLGIATLCLYLRYGLRPVSNIITGPVVLERNEVYALQHVFVKGFR